jgi:hypothetical protein
MKPDLMMDAALLVVTRGGRNGENAGQKSREHPVI